MQNENTRRHGDEIYRFIRSHRPFLFRVERYPFQSPLIRTFSRQTILRGASNQSYELSLAVYGAMILSRFGYSRSMA
jgi:hypothetical protein